MKLGKEKIENINTRLTGFIGHQVFTLGATELPFERPCEATIFVRFLVLEGKSSYNAIIEWVTLNRLKAIVSTHHLKMKFPIKAGIIEVEGDQEQARICYLLDTQMTEETVAIEHREELRAQSVKPLEEISLWEDLKEQTVRIGTNLLEESKKILMAVLRANSEVFAWLHEDMPGIDPKLITHKLNIHPEVKPVI